MSQIKKTTMSGATSIFIVIFSVILLVIIVTSFIRVMLEERQRAIESDLNQSARDSALAGVEDAKRALLKYRKQICAQDAVRCKDILDDFLNGQNCDPIQEIMGIGAVGQETMLETKRGVDQDLEQAYTCVKINYDTVDYKRDMLNNEAIIIPLRARDGFNQIKFSWHTVRDNNNNDQIKNSGFPGGKLFANNYLSDPKIPPVMRLEHIRFNSDLGSYDRESGTLYKNDALRGNRNFDVVYLRPANSDAKVGFDQDNKDNKINKDIISNVKCSKNVNNEGFYCSQTMNLRVPVASNSGGDYLRVNNLFKSTSIRVEMLNNGVMVPLVGIQPEIDSNGRANDVYRRVKARVEFMDEQFTYPKGAIEIQDGDFCKKFEMTKNVLVKNACSW